ncbi:MAG: calcium/sodium antiporter [Bacteroidales bacterium]|nr:calcium/sodium antiporter [Bacteroidales bacterium]
MQIVLLIAGLALIVFGADWLVDGASAIARKAGISEFVIGLTIVGFGTSCPELVVSLTGALQGNADISVGNVIGSNIFNTLLILGMTAVIAPIAVTRTNSRRDIPIVMLVTFLFAFFCLSGEAINRWEGIAFLAIFIAYLVYCFKTDAGDASGDEEASAKVMNIWLAILLVAAGLGGLILGGQLFVNNATAIARAVGVSDKFIAITLLAGGTSLPELATCIVAAAKKKDQLALGNVLGSNVFNILLILGTSAVVTPLSTLAITWVDLGVLLLSVILVWLWTYTGKRDRIDRWEAVLMLLCFVAYYIWLFMKL